MDNRTLSQSLRQFRNLFKLSYTFKGGGGCIKQVLSTKRGVLILAESRSTIVFFTVVFKVEASTCLNLLVYLLLKHRLQSCWVTFSDHDSQNIQKAFGRLRGLYGVRGLLPELAYLRLVQTFLHSTFNYSYPAYRSIICREDTAKIEKVQNTSVISFVSAGLRQYDSLLSLSSFRDVPNLLPMEAVCTVDKVLAAGYVESIYLYTFGRGFNSKCRSPCLGYSTHARTEGFIYLFIDFLYIFFW